MSLAGTPRHVVQFYESDVQLGEAVASYLTEAVRAGGAAVVIAEPVRRDLVVAGLLARGVDVAQARRTGALLERDAADTLASFGDDAGLDEAAFTEVIGRVLAGAAARGGPVRAYGEMVGLLWAADRLRQALDLEAMWNQLASQLPFELYCGYPAPGDTDRADTLRRIAEVHNAVHGAHLPTGLISTRTPPDVVGFYDPDPYSAAAARALVGRALREAGIGENVVEDAVAVVAELASNAIRHAGTGYSVTVAWVPAGVRITVTDANPGPPAPRATNPLDRSGRGLPIITALTHDWGHRPVEGGKAVWVELAHAPSAAPPTGR
jgi:anti-sigma regulatory factor (Ser/Thr protein kinase)